MMRSLCLVAVVGGIASAAPTPPTDAYAKKLAGKTIDDGKGFPGIVAIGDPCAGDVQGARPRARDCRGAVLVLLRQGLVDARRGRGDRRRDRQLRDACDPGLGDRAPATSKGVRVGDAVKKITSAYGAGQPFTSTVGSPMLANLVSVDLATGKAHAAAGPREGLQGRAGTSRARHAVRRRVVVEGLAHRRARRRGSAARVLARAREAIDDGRDRSQARRARLRAGQASRARGAAAGAGPRGRVLDRRAEGLDQGGRQVERSGQQGRASRSRNRPRRTNRPSSLPRPRRPSASTT